MGDEIFFHTPEIPIEPTKQSVPPAIILRDKYTDPVYPQLSDYGKGVLMSIVNYGGVTWTPGYIQHKLTYDELQGYVSGRWKPFANLLLAEAPKEPKDNPYARNRRFTVDPRSRSIVIDNGLNRLRTGPWLNSGREPWREWGPFYSNLDRSTTWICCGRPVKDDSVNNGCWKYSKESLVPYDFMPAIRKYDGNKTIIEAWKEIVVGTPWLDYDYYRKLDEQIQKLKNTKGLMEFVHNIRLNGIDYFRNNPNLASTLARLYVLENEYNEVHGSYRWFADFGQPQWIEYMAKDMGVWRELEVVPSLSRKSDSVIENIKKDLTEFLERTLEEGDLRKLFLDYIKNIKNAYEKDPIMFNINIAKVIQDFIAKIDNYESRKYFFDGLQKIKTPSELSDEEYLVEQTLLDQGDFEAAILLEKFRLKQLIYILILPMEVKKAFYRVIDASKFMNNLGIIRDLVKNADDIIFSGLLINNDMENRFKEIQTIDDLEKLIDNVKQVKSSSREVKEDIVKTNLPEPLKQKLLESLRKLTTQEALTQLGLEIEKESKDAKELLKLIDELPNAPNAVKESFEETYNNADSKKELDGFIKVLREMTSIVKSLPENAKTKDGTLLRTTFYNKVLDTNGFKAIREVMKRASNLEKDATTEHRPHSYTLADIKNIQLPPAETKGLPKKFGLKWEKNSCWIDSALVMLFAFRNTSLVREVVSAKKITLFPENKVYKFEGVDYYVETEKCDGNEFHKNLLTDISNLQNDSNPPQVCTLRPLWAKCLPKTERVPIIEGGEFSDPMVFIKSMKQMYNFDKVVFSTQDDPEDIYEPNVSKPFYVVRNSSGSIGQKENVYPLEISDGNFVRIALIASQRENGHHFITLLRHPKSNKTVYVNFSNDGGEIVRLTDTWDEDPQKIIGTILREEYVHFHPDNPNNDYQHFGTFALYIHNTEKDIENELGHWVKIEESEAEPEANPDTIPKVEPEITNKELLENLKEDAKTLYTDIQNLTNEKIYEQQQEKYNDIKNRIQLVLDRSNMKSKTDDPLKHIKELYRDFITSKLIPANIFRLTARRLLLVINIIELSQYDDAAILVRKEIAFKLVQLAHNDIEEEEVEVQVIIEDDEKVGDKKKWLDYYFKSDGMVNVRRAPSIGIRIGRIYPILEQIETDPDYRLSDTQYHWDKIYEDLIDPLSELAEAHQDKIEDIGAFERMGVYPRGRLEEESLPLHFQTKYLHAMSVIGQMLYGLQQGQEQVDEELKARIEAEWPSN